VAGISWPLPAEWTDEFVEQRLFVRAGVKPGRRRHTEPDWAALARELKRSGVNLMVLWEEYRESHPDGYGYSRFCDLYREFERRLSPVMRQHHVAGDKMFVDYSGKKIAIVDASTGEVRDTEIFVAVLGASNYTYPEATWTQTLPDWIEANRKRLPECHHVLRTLAFIPVFISSSLVFRRAHREAAPRYDNHFGALLTFPKRILRPKSALLRSRQRCRTMRTSRYRQHPAARVSRRHSGDHRRRNSRSLLRGYRPGWRRRGNERNRTRRGRRRTSRLPCRPYGRLRRSRDQDVLIVDRDRNLRPLLALRRRNDLASHLEEQVFHVEARRCALARGPTAKKPGRANRGADPPKRFGTITADIAAPPGRYGGREAHRSRAAVGAVAYATIAAPALAARGLIPLSRIDRPFCL
jgi:hypothetical protein